MGQERQLSDRKLREMFDSGDDLSILTAPERKRLLELTGDGGGPPSPSVMDERGMADRAVDHLPAVLSSVGGFLGGTKRTASGAALAGLGAAGGEGIRQVIRSIQGRSDEVPSTPEDQLSRMAGAAATGAGVELGGRAVIGGLTRLAPRLMKTALGAQTEVRKAFPDVNLERAALDAKAIPGNAGSLRAVESAGEQSAQRLRNDLKVIDLASGNAPVATYADATSVLRNRVPDALMAARGGASEELSAVREGFRKVRPMQRSPLNAESTFVAKQAHQDAAKSAYQAKTGAQGDATAEVSGDLANGLVNALRTKHPEIATSLLKQQEAMALTRAMENAQPRTSLLRNIMSGTAGAGAGMAVMGATGNPVAALASGVAVPAVTHLFSSPGSLARMGISSEAGARIMQSAGARLPDEMVRKQLMDLILGSAQQQRD